MEEDNEVNCHTEEAKADLVAVVVMVVAVVAVVVVVKILFW